MFRTPIKRSKPVSKKTSGGRKMGTTQKMVARFRGQGPLRVPGALRLTGSEIKAIDIAATAYTFQQVGTPPTLTLLNGIQVGAGFFNRIGSKVEMKSLHIRGQLFNLATTVQDYLRVIIFYDRQPNGAAPTFADLMQSRDQAGTATTSAKSEINLDQRDRFVILRDRQWQAPSVTLTAGVQTNGPNFPGMDQEWDINEFIKLNDLTTHYKSSTNPTTIADINSGALYMTLVSDQAAGKWQYVVGFRLRFGDK